MPHTHQVASLNGNKLSPLDNIYRQLLINGNCLSLKKLKILSSFLQHHRKKGWHYLFFLIILPPVIINKTYNKK